MKAVDKSVKTKGTNVFVFGIIARLNWCAVHFVVTGSVFPIALCVVIHEAELSRAVQSINEIKALCRCDSHSSHLQTEYTNHHESGKCPVECAVHVKSCRQSFSTPQYHICELICDIDVSL